MSSTRIESLVDEVQRAFDEPPEHIETGLNVDDAALLQFRKACRLLAGSAQLLEAGYYTLVIEASFATIERSIEFRLLDRGEMDPRNLPGSHTSIYREAANIGIFSDQVANDGQSLEGSSGKNVLLGRSRGGKTRETTTQSRDRGAPVHRWAIIPGIRVSLYVVIHLSTGLPGHDR